MGKQYSPPVSVLGKNLVLLGFAAFFFGSAIVSGLIMKRFSENSNSINSPIQNSTTLGNELDSLKHDQIELFKHDSMVVDSVGKIRLLPD